MGGEYEDKALESFKRAIYYLLRSGFKIGYRPTAYKFTSCSDRLLDYLRKEQIPLTPPRVFNDPFDCIIFKFLGSNDKAVQLVKRAYDECLSVACFTQNEMLPLLSSSVVQYKSGAPLEDYKDELMWAHYADSHRGICIKYNLSICADIHGQEDNGVFLFVRDVVYSSGALEAYSVRERRSMPISDFFFLKGDAWKYEKELRLVRFDLKGKGGYTCISAPGCIEAIYFGLRCSEDDKRTIRSILMDKRFKGSDIKEEEHILFYEMEEDPEHFGRVRVKNTVSLS